MNPLALPDGHQQMMQQPNQLNSPMNPANMAKALRDMGKLPNQQNPNQNAPYGSGVSPYMPWNQNQQMNQYQNNPYVNQGQ